MEPTDDATPVPTVSFVDQKAALDVKPNIALTERDVHRLITDVVEKRAVRLEGMLLALRTSLPGSVDVEVKKQVHKELFNPTTSFQVNFARPTLGLLQRWSTSPSSPGNKINDAFKMADHRLSSLEGLLNSLNHTVNGLSAQSQRSGATAGGTTGATHPLRRGGWE
ncbi:hypothetical protein ACA910_012010 [Epithemia clementina (nom. ined.)]